MNIMTTRAAQTAGAEPNIARGRLQRLHLQAQARQQRATAPRHISQRENAGTTQVDSEHLGFALLGIGLESSTA